ncbi:aspartate/glutamate racemase family protein (plasmid) [Gemmobacter fulvus]|uniref:Hydantoin racemase n=1 Tax=Gemmobacter fulvus TaxID=2840474 RepID=A0A975S420_9RHOB|nr:aspartate/glutamate racemase family protein [Gemmobacter fulvus]MBT9246521.1 aspartate/glutamate racemase family protein [Gemmobacter fulvus]QWK92618.1 aspartate/glutamate racemase family protein [Gemmobacter fulvus]
MKILVINPNSTLSMTMQIADSARRCAFPGTVIEAINPKGTPASIEGHADEAMSVPAMLDLIRAGEARGVDAYVIACFDDPGLAAAREIAAGPVIGICQAAVQVATTIATRFSIVTTLPRSVPIIEDLVEAYGAGHRCRAVRAVDMPVLALEQDPTTAEARLIREIEAARDVDGAEAVVLGCAGMSDLCDRLQLQTGMPVIDGVTAAVKLAEGLVGGGYATSKIGAYDYPRAKSACVLAQTA